MKNLKFHQDLPAGRLAKEQEPHAASASLSLNNKVRRSEGHVEAVRLQAPDEGVRHSRLTPALILDSLSSEDKRSAASLLAKSFITREPLVLALKNTAGVSQAMEKYAIKLVDAVAPYGVSAIRKDGQGKVVALALAAPLDAHLPELPGQLAPIGALLDELMVGFSERRAAASKDATFKKTLNMLMLAADQGLQGKYVHRAAIVKSFVAAHEQGYDDVVILCTSVSRLISEQAGMKPLKEVVYSKFKYNGEAVFADVQGHKGAVAAWLPLPELLDNGHKMVLQAAAQSQPRSRL